MAVSGTRSAAVRTWSTQVIAGDSRTWPFETDDVIGALTEVAHDEGVVALVDEMLRQDAAKGDKPAVPLAVCEAFEAGARGAALLSMIFEGETAAVLRTMAAAQTPSLLLKGNALAYWAYPQPHWRACSDVDVLLPSRDAAETLAAGLQQQGYERLQTSGDLVAYELMCHRAINGQLKAEIDVHWALSNSALFANVFSFDELMADSVALPALGANARALGPVHACVHACVHRAENLAISVPDRLKWLYDIVLIVQHFDE